uniref:Uncharacterized protein n=1 Tax=Solanum lycopersicum TaxID=4081 RepID=A0A3Q7I9M0_SOLLC
MGFSNTENNQTQQEDLRKHFIANKVNAFMEALSLNVSSPKYKQSSSIETKNEFQQHYCQVADKNDHEIHSIAPRSRRKCLLLQMPA